MRMSIICPEGVGAGELVEVTAPSGALLQVTVSFCNCPAISEPQRERERERERAIVVGAGTRGRRPRGRVRGQRG